MAAMTALREAGEEYEREGLPATLASADYVTTTGVLEAAGLLYLLELLGTLRKRALQAEDSELRVLGVTRNVER